MAELMRYHAQSIPFDPAAYTPRPIETVVQNVIHARANPYHPAPGVTVTTKHDGTRFHSITIESAETSFTLQGEDFDYVPGYAQLDFYHQYCGFLIEPGLRGGVTAGVPESGSLIGWNAQLTKRRFAPDWYYKPLDSRVMNVLLTWRIDQPPSENPFDHLAESIVHCSFGTSPLSVRPEMLARSAT